MLEEKAKYKLCTICGLADVRVGFFFFPFLFPPPSSEVVCIDRTSGIREAHLRHHTTMASLARAASIATMLPIIVDSGLRDGVF